MVTNNSLVLTFAILIMTLSSFAQTKLKVGDAAPDFNAKDQNGRIVTLSSLKNKKVILYFYPKDDTPGCTAESCNLRDNNEALIKAGYIVLGVSADDELSHTNFVNKYALPFSLLADTEKSIINKYGVWVEKERNGNKFMGIARVTFVIDEKGLITKIIDQVNTADHYAQIIK